MIKGSLKPFNILLFLVSYLLFVPSYASTQDLEQQALEYIQEQLQSTLVKSDRIDIKIQPLSSHLKLSPCRTSITFKSKQSLHAGRFNLKASCQSPRHWSVNIRGLIKVMREVVISLRPLPRNTILSGADVKLSLQDISSLQNGYFSNLDEINGYELKTSVPQNKVLNPTQLLPLLLVRKDDQVTIHAGKSELLSVRVAGIALEDGSINEQIRIQNAKSGKIIRARVVASGEVRAGN
ncbi:MAG: flagellar basal body P-ring formation chaperone FlgA [Motiliproteus sp.]